MSASAASVPTDLVSPERAQLLLPLLETSLSGVFAVGDVRANSAKRVAAAAGEGSMAVRFAHQHLGQLAS
jgi:thioredoxin reductase